MIPVLIAANALMVLLVILMLVALWSYEKESQRTHQMIRESFNAGMRTSESYVVEAFRKGMATQRIASEAEADFPRPMGVIHTDKPPLSLVPDDAA